MNCKTCQNFLGTDYYEDIGIIVLCKQLGQVKPSREATCEYEAPAATRGDAARSILDQLKDLELTPFEAEAIKQMADQRVR